MKPILCAIDFSTSTLRVMEAAFGAANTNNTDVTILFVYRLVQTSGGLTEYKKNMEAQARKNFDALVKQMRIKDLVKYEFRSEIGFLTDRIEDYVHKNAIGLIVLSQHMADTVNDHQGLTLKDFIGSTKVPFLIVSEKEHSVKEDEYN
jgi:hypothetical protein